MWGEILYWILRIVTWIIGFIGADEETKKKLEEFLLAAANDKKSVQLMKAGKKQLSYIKNHPFKKTEIVKPIQNG